MTNWEKLNKEFDDAMAQFDKWADYKLRLADVSGKNELYESVRETIKERLVALYEKGKARYVSW